MKVTVLFLSICGLGSSLATEMRQAQQLEPNKGAACKLQCDKRGPADPCSVRSDCRRTSHGCIDNFGKTCKISDSGGTLCAVSGTSPCGYGDCTDDATGRYYDLPVGEYAGHCPTRVQKCQQCSDKFLPYCKEYTDAAKRKKCEEMACGQYCSPLPPNACEKCRKESSICRDVDTPGCQADCSIQVLEVQLISNSDNEHQAEDLPMKLRKPSEVLQSWLSGV
ncbi:hypothetical protein PT974_03169 [Cladobotryum mycophilum]|uniref:Uncharacterized protein n=1 Tax=Cladobotryum mycophilum TaxID=491253 RepID=A0ABR0SSP0_9HYPO